MSEFVRTLEAPAFHWKDVVGPAHADLTALAKQYGLHRRAVEDCLDPAHLPKFERLGDKTFIILRAWDRHAPEGADTVTALTRKVAIFVSDEFLLSIHRKDLRVIAALREHWQPDARDPRTGLLADIINAALSTYREPLESLIDELDRYEENIFKSRSEKDLMPALYAIKRRAYILKRMIWLHREILEKLHINSKDDPHLEDTMDNAAGLLFQAEDLHESVTGLISLHLSIASHRTNEVMRLLTIFSVFFLPLTFIVGVYGMNFDYMPELRLQWGYPATLLAMGSVSLSMFLWLRYKGWLK